MLSVGSSQVKKLYLGDSEQKKAYLGDKIVLDNSGPHYIIGIDWHQTSLPTISDAFYTSIAYGNGVFVVVSSSNQAAYSYDGINWSKTTLPFSQEWSAVVYGKDKFVAVGPSSTEYAYSTDGIKWSTVQTTYLGAAQDIAYGNGRFVTLSANNSANYSPDGLNWNYWGSRGYGKCICYGEDESGNGIFISPEYGKQTSESSSRIFYSKDGTNWKNRLMGVSGNYQNAVYGNKTFVINAGSSQYLTYSKNGGLTWTQIHFPNSGEGDWSGLAYGNGLFVIVKNRYLSDYDSTEAAYSEDGVNWNKTSIPPGNWRKVAYGNGKFVALSVWYGGNIAAYSYTG